MNTAVSRQRGVEHDIVQRPETNDVAPYYEAQGNEIQVFEAAARRNDNRRTVGLAAFGQEGCQRRLRDIAKARFLIGSGRSRFFLFGVF